MPQKISFRSLYDFLQCEKRHYLKSKLKLKGKEDLFREFQVQLLKTLKTIIRNNISRQQAEKMLSLHISTIDRNWFDLSQEMQQHKNNLKCMYMRFLDYYYSNNLKLVASDVKYTVLYKGFEITGKVDMVLQTNKSEYEAVKFKLSAPTISSFARTEENKPVNCFELALMYEGLRRRYTNLKVSFYHLPNRDDTSVSLVPIFNNKANKNIVSAVFNAQQAEQSIHRVLEKKDLLKAITLPEEHYSQNKKDCKNCNFTMICKLSDESVTISHRKKHQSNGADTSKVSSFNSKQLQAIEHHKGPLRIFASAGTGKTAVLVKRYESMIQKGIEPSHILLVSFSRKAVEELRSRISVLTGLNDTMIQCYTYNGFCSGILAAFGRLLTYNDLPFYVLSSVERKKFITKFLEKIPAKPGISYLYPLGEYGIITKMDKITSRLLDTCCRQQISDYETARNLYKKYDDQILTLCHLCTNELVAYMKANNYITYQDQILFVKELFKKYPYISLHLANKYQYIMCDEFQDTDPNQSFVIYSIAKHHYNICICGDDSQSIYKFRGADNSNIIEFHKHFKGCVDVFLDVNYRSNSEIVDLGESIISKNINRVPKSVHAVKHSTAAVSFTQISSLDTLVYIVESILRNSQPRDIAIIARTNSSLERIYDKLSEAGVPARLNQSGADNNIELLRVLNFLSVMYDQCSDVDRYCFAFINGANPTRTTESIISDYWTAVSHLGLKSQLAALTDYLISGPDVILYLNELIEIEKITSLHSLYNRLVEIIDYKDSVPIENELTNEITLITSHSSKGKEYNYVIIPDICEFVDKDDMEEARRVLFVAVTRARVQVYVCSKGNSEFSEDVISFLSLNNFN